LPNRAAFARVAALKGDTPSQETAMKHSTKSSNLIRANRRKAKRKAQRRRQRARA